MSRLFTGFRDLDGDLVDRRPFEFCARFSDSPIVRGHTELDQYARPDAHARGAIYANRYLKTNFGQGSKPKHVYISHVRDTYPQTDVICFEYGGEVPGCFVVDMDVMQKKGFQEPLKRVTDALGWNWNEIDPTRTTLAMFGMV